MSTQFPHENNEGLARVAYNDATLYALAHMLYESALDYTAMVLLGNPHDVASLNGKLKNDIFSMLGGFEQIRSVQVQ